MKIKLLFQGDSITDAGRSREDPIFLAVGIPNMRLTVYILQKKAQNLSERFTANI